MLTALSQSLSAGSDLNPVQIAAAVEQLTDESIPVETKAEFLAALARKGETVEEIAAFAHALREKSLAPPLDTATRAREILDVCGTGGDHLRTFNISTTVALVVAAAEVTVAKHGNRAITSQSGSADVLQALGIPIESSPAEVAARLRDHHFAFLFAPKFHPSFRHIGPARKLCAERGQRTIFNLLGPLLNPARPSAQLLGVPRPELCEPMARVLQALGIRRGMVVCGQVTMPGTGKIAHLDELSTLGENTVAEFYQDRGFMVSTLSPDNFPLQSATLADLAGGDAATNAEITRRLLRGEERGPKRDAVLFNAAAALFVAGHAGSMMAGWEQAETLLDNGTAWKKLQTLAAPTP